MYRQRSARCPKRAGNASTSVAGHRPRVIAWAGGAGCLNMVAALRPMPLARWQCLNFSGTGVRHEAPCNRVEVKDLRRWAVAAAW